MKSIRVLVIDDSALMRRLLCDLLDSEAGIEVVGSAPDPFIARQRIKALRPDVLTLDVEMPRMDGLQFLSNLMRLHPMPVVMVSSHTARGAEPTLRALELGAVDFVLKPRLETEDAMPRFAAELVRKVRAAANSQLTILEATAVRNGTGVLDVELNPPQAGGAGKFSSDSIIAIGASTGGTTAIREVLAELPPDCPPVVIAQHIPPVFSRSFAERLDRHCPLTVCEAADGDRLRPGHAYVAPGDFHLEVRQQGQEYFCRVHSGERVLGHMPSVNVLFESVALVYGERATAALLTGMGKDGAEGLLKLRRTGAATIAQDEQTSQIWGMPRAAVELDAATEIVALPDIARRLLANALAQEPGRAADNPEGAGRLRTGTGRRTGR